MKAKPHNPPPAKLSALEQRSEREDWSQADRTNRTSRAQALRLLHRHYKAADPQRVWHLLRLIQIHMMRCTADCRELDRLRHARGDEPLFVEAFATFDDQRVFDALHFRACEQIKAEKPLGDRAKRLSATVLGIVKDRMRDGCTSTEVLKAESRLIERMASEGNTAFFEALGALLNEARRRPEKYSKRTLSDWIVRAWLPLCLWECPINGIEAHTRITEAASLLGLEAPAMKPFRKAWQNVRRRAMKMTVDAQSA